MKYEDFMEAAKGGSLAPPHTVANTIKHTGKGPGAKLTTKPFKPGDLGRSPGFQI